MESSHRSPNDDFRRLQKDSPYPPAGVNLTGLPRRIKDSCADIYNASKRWEKCKLQGVRTMRRIAAIKSEDTTDELKLDEVCTDLIHVVEDLAKVVDTIISVRKNFEALVKINLLKSSTDNNNIRETDIPFLTYSVNKYLELILLVEKAYAKELELKKTLIKRVPLQNKQALFTFINVTWLHDAFITEDIAQTVLTLIAECGFK